MEKDKYKSQKKYIKNNIKKLGCSFPKELVDEFTQACKILNIKQTDVIRNAMQETINKAKKPNSMS